LLEHLPNVTILDRILSRDDVYTLEALCDAFVSLHRSEGFGLGLAESMFLGKPVIGTNWSGNRDFMDAKNSCPVDVSLVPIEEDHGPYRKGQLWAEADIDQAAWYMRRLVNDAGWRHEIGARARQTKSPARRLIQTRVEGVWLVS
jgi:glycosyltransferase involved in cell wall biosynthesis